MAYFAKDQMIVVICRVVINKKMVTLMNFCNGWNNHLVMMISHIKC